MSIPSREECIEAFGLGKGRALYRMLAGHIPPTRFPSVQKWIGQCLHMPSKRSLQMKAADAILDGHGVESIYVGIDYVNMGDTYNTTLLLQGSIFSIGDWGSAVESYTDEQEPEAWEEYGADDFAEALAKVSGCHGKEFFQALGSRLLGAIWSKLSESCDRVIWNEDGSAYFPFDHALKPWRQPAMTWKQVRTVIRDVLVDTAGQRYAAKCDAKIRKERGE